MGTFGNEFFQNLVEQTNDLIIRIDNRWRLRYLSPSVTKLMVHNKSAHIGGHVLSLFHPADRRNAITALAASIACRASSASVEARTPSIHGDVQDIMWTVSFNFDNKDHIQWIGAIGRNISKLKTTEEQLRKREEMWSLLFRASPTWIVLATLDQGRLIDCNDAFCRDTGYKKEEVIGRTSVEIGLWRGRPDREDMLQVIRLNKSLDKEPVNLGMKNGEIRDMLWSTTTLAIQGEQCLLSVLVDVTDLRNTERKLAAINEKLQTRSSELAEMNSALKVLLQHREEDKKDLESRVWHNIQNMIHPHLLKLISSPLSASQRAYLDIVKHRLDEISSSLGERLGKHALSLSTRELEIAGHIIEGHRNKTIAEILNISVYSVESHRFSIRKKLGILGKKTNLRTKLIAMSKPKE